MFVIRVFIIFFLTINHSYSDTLYGTGKVITSQCSGKISGKIINGTEDFYETYQFRIDQWHKSKKYELGWFEPTGMSHSFRRIKFQKQIFNSYYGYKDRDRFRINNDIIHWENLVNTPKSYLIVGRLNLKNGNLNLTVIYTIDNDTKAEAVAKCRDISQLGKILGSKTNSGLFKSILGKLIGK